MPEAPGAHGGPVAHIEQWVAGHLAPEIAEIKGAVAKVADFAGAHAAWAESVTDLAVKLAETADPADAAAIQALAERVKRGLADLQRIAQAAAQPTV